MRSKVDFGTEAVATLSSDLFEILSRHSILARTDKSGRILEVNDKFCEVSGYSREELIGHTHKLVNSGLHSDTYWQDIWATISGGRIWQGEICNRSKAGALYWGESTLSPLFNVQRRITGYFAVWTDITRQKLSNILGDAEREALDRISRGMGLNKACGSIVEGLSNIDPQMNISVLSATRSGALKHVAAVGLSKAYIKAIDGVKIGPAVGSCGAAAYSGETVIVNDVSNHPNWVAFKDLAAGEGIKACWSFPILNAARKAVGTIAAYYGEIRSPTVLETRMLTLAAATLSLAFKAKSDRLKLVDAKIQAEATAEARRLFISNMNHELRTPLNHILGFTELLYYDPKYADDLSSIEPIKAAGLELLAKVEKAIEVSSSHEAVVKDAFNLYQFLQSEIEPLLVALNTHGGRNTSISLGPEGTLVNFSRQNLKKALKYVLENAFKFTTEPNGEVKVSVTIDFMENMANIAVIDNGKGIDQSFVITALLALEVEDPSFTRQHDGMGLGLTAAHALMQQSMGELHLDSQAGTGTTVTLKVPLQAPEVV